LRKALLPYLKDEANVVGFHFDESEWDCEAKMFSPQQGRTLDCGLYSLLTTEFLASKVPLAVTANNVRVLSQKNMPYFRQKIAIDILHNKFRY
jgi:Ulp1 family protease